MMDECELCFAPSTLRCPGCRAPFCGEKHFKILWPTHKLGECRPDKRFLSQPPLLDAEVLVMLENQWEVFRARGTSSAAELEHYKPNQVGDVDRYRLHLNKQINSYTPFMRAKFLAGIRCGLFDDNDKLDKVYKVKHAVHTFAQVARFSTLSWRHGISEDEAYPFFYRMFIMQAVINYPTKDETKELERRALVEALMMKLFQDVESIPKDSNKRRIFENFVSIFLYDTEVSEVRHQIISGELSEMEGKMAIQGRTMLKEMAQQHLCNLEAVVPELKVWVS